MKTKTCTALIGLMAICFIAVPKDLMAYGFGVAGSFGSGSLKATTGSFFGGGASTANYDQTRRSIGLVYDNNVGQDKIFNYRLGVLYQELKANSSEGGFHLDGLAVESDFGFSIARTEAVRFWVGPGVKIEYLEGSETDATGYKSHENVLGIGMGPVAGLNFHLVNDISLAVRGGYMFQDGVRLFSDWDEKYGFFSIGLIYKLGADKAD